MMKKHGPLFCVFFFLVTVFLTACGNNEELPQGIPSVPTGRIMDLSEAFDPEEEEMLSRVIDHYESTAGGQICVLTVKSTDGIPINDYTMRILNKWKIGEVKKNDGVMITLAIADKCSRIDVGLGLEDVLTDSRCEDLLRGIVPELQREEYANACANLIKGMESIRRESKSE